MSVLPYFLTTNEKSREILEFLTKDDHKATHTMSFQLHSEELPKFLDEKLSVLTY